MEIKPILFSTPMVQAILEGRKTQTRRVIKPQPEEWKQLFSTDDTKFPIRKKAQGFELIKSKYNKGDILWVRETFAEITNGHNETFIEYKANGNTGDWKWKPSIYMPKKAARIFLEVTNVRAERLQDITGEDSVNEGVPNGPYAINPVTNFKKLWDSINSKRHPWESNPWVWVYDFERTTRPKEF